MAAMACDNILPVINTSFVLVDGVTPGMVSIMESSIRFAAFAPPTIRSLLKASSKTCAEIRRDTVDVRGLVLFLVTPSRLPSLRSSASSAITSLAVLPLFKVFLVRRIISPKISLDFITSAIFDCEIGLVTGSGTSVELRPKFSCDRVWSFAVLMLARFNPPLMNSAVLTIIVVKGLRLAIFSEGSVTTE